MKRFSSLLFFILILFACIRKNPPRKLEDNLFYDKAFAYKESGKQDSSFLYFNKAKDLFLQQKDSFGVARSLLQMALISTNEGDYFGGQELSLAAIPYFNKEKKKHHIYIVSNYNNLGLTLKNLTNYEQAIYYYKQSLAYSNKDSVSSIIVMNNIADSYSKIGDYQKSLALYNVIQKIGVENKNEYARILTNSTSVRWLQNSSYKAVPYFLKALQIRKDKNDLVGLHSSYGHLSDYYVEKNKDSALFYAEQMYKVAQKFNNPQNRLMALQKLIKLSGTHKIKRYFLIYEELNDSIQNARASAKNQFALIRYETEKHKADNLVLKKDNAESRYQIIKQKVILLAAVALIVLGSIFSVYWYKKRKKAHQKEKELEIKNTELKYVKKVHDRVANKVYNVMMEVENTVDLNKTTLADKLESIYKISRDISYENTDIDGRQIFTQQLHQMLTSYSSHAIEISVDGNNEALWQHANETVKSEIITILQELMTNMMKHSQATVVNLDFKRIDNRINIIYLDNGIGIIGEPIFKNGLKNTGNRIEEIDGVINFDINVQKGLKIEISFPVF